MQGITMLEPVTASTERFVSTVADLGDGHMGGTTLVPPWTRGHVITHVARASDSLCRLLEWARTGVEVPQYPSMEARAAEIEAGAARAAHEQVRDVIESAARLDEAVRTLPAPAWQAVVRPRTGELCTPERLVAMRLRELEIHHADLDAGYSFTDVPEPIARLVIDDIVDTQSGRDGTPPLRIRATDTDLDRELGEHGPVVTGTLAGILAWLTGRSDGSPGPAGPGLSVSGADAVPAAPYWILAHSPSRTVGVCSARSAAAVRTCAGEHGVRAVVPVRHPTVLRGIRPPCGSRLTPVAQRVRCGLVSHM